MKSKILFTIITIVYISLIVGCKKDNFREIVVACPYVEFTNPANGAIGVPLNQNISIIFNENMNSATFASIGSTTSVNMDSATFVQSSCDLSAPFTLKGEKLVAGTISYNGTTAKFTPSGNLLPGTTYTATITTTIRNCSGVPLARNYSWSFTTVGGKSNNVFNRNIQDNKKDK
jgi:hypothetical protein